MNRLVFFLLLSFAVLITLSSPGFAATYNVGRGDSVLLTTTCVYNGVLYADNATTQIYGVGNVSVLNATFMNKISPGVFALNYTFNVSGDYLTVESCVFPGGVVHEGSDEYRVGESWYALLLLAVGVALLLASVITRGGAFVRPMRFFSAVMFVLFVVAAGANFYISVTVLLLALVIMMSAFKMRA